MYRYFPAFPQRSSLPQEVEKSSMISFYRLMAIAGVVSVVQGCATTHFFQDNHLIPDAQRLKKAAIHASTDMMFVVPAVASAAVFASGKDKQISNWASTRAPIFGSMSSADRTSNYLRDASILAYTLTVFGDVKYLGSSNSLYLPLLSPLAGLSAVGATTLLTTGLKSGTGRCRPDGSDLFSFPSGHSATASLFATMASNNITRFDWPKLALFAGNTGLSLLAMSTAWARVEADKHYLSDALAGVAIGHFIGTFVNDLFLSPESGVSMDLNVGPGSRGWNASMGVTIPLSLFGRHPKSADTRQAAIN